MFEAQASREDSGRFEVSEKAGAWKNSDPVNRSIVIVLTMAANKLAGNLERNLFIIRCGRYGFTSSGN